MAEAFLQDILSSGNGYEGITLSSAGLQAVEGENPPAEVIEVMREYDLDVSRHRSHLLNAEDVKDADLILTMAMHNSSRLLTEHQEGRAERGNALFSLIVLEHWLRIFA